MSLPSIILLGSCKKVGKDTLCQCLTQLNPHFHRFAFADALKDDLTPFIEQRFGFYLPTCTPEEKELVRPLLIVYGMTQRQIDPDHWIKRLDQNIELFLRYSPRTIPVITDCRFLNESVYFKHNYPGAIYIQINRTEAPPPTEEEEKHWKILAEQADFTLNWGNNSEEERMEIAGSLLRKIIKN